MSELSDLILSHATRPSNPTLVPGLTLFRSDLARSLNVKVLYMPMVSVMAQGEKDVVLGDVTFHCTPLALPRQLSGPGGMWDCFPRSAGGPVLVVDVGVGPEFGAGARNRNRKGQRT